MGIKILIALHCMLVMAGCSVSTENLSQPDSLKAAIAHSINVPFHSGDTLIYDSFIGICGNSSRDELNRYYEPHLNNQPYIDILKRNYSGVILCTDDSLYAHIHQLYKDKSGELTPWELFSKNKIILSVRGKVLTNDAVKIYENYDYNGEHYLKEKLFVYTGSEWKYKIVNENAID